MAVLPRANLALDWLFHFSTGFRSAFCDWNEPSVSLYPILMGLFSFRWWLTCARERRPDTFSVVLQKPFDLRKYFFNILERLFSQHQIV
jgi:hypothetical protein